MENKKHIVEGLPFLLLLASFLEGGAVMAIELISAKLIAPFYGNSLYVWSAVFASTLSGLAVGYFIGGAFSDKPKKRKALIAVVFIVAVLVLLMPSSSSVILESTLPFNLKAGIVVSCIVFVFPPLLCFGMVSPLIIGVAEKFAANPGKLSGIVYAVSTAGGILFTFLTGFVLIPAFGLRLACYFISFLLFLSAGIIFFETKKSSKYLS